MPLTCSAEESSRDFMSARLPEVRDAASPTSLTVFSSLIETVFAAVEAESMEPARSESCERRSELKLPCASSISWASCWMRAFTSSWSCLASLTPFSRSVAEERRRSAIARCVEMTPLTREIVGSRRDFEPSGRISLSDVRLSSSCW